MVRCFTVTFDTNGGSTIEPVKVIDGDLVEEPDNPIKDDDVFEGWFLDNNTFVNAYEFDTPITGNLTLYAKWDAGGGGN